MNKVEYCFKCNKVTTHQFTQSLTPLSDNTTYINETYTCEECNTVTINKYKEMIYETDKEKK